MALYRYFIIIIIIISSSSSFSFSSSSFNYHYYYHHHHHYCYYYYYYYLIYYSEHKDTIHNKCSNMTSKKESGVSLSINVHKLASPFCPDHSENLSVDNDNGGVSQWNSLKQTMHLTSSTEGFHRSTPRPYPKNVNSKTPFQICKHYASGMRCRETCTFAHGEEELSEWTMQRDKGV